MPTVFTSATRHRYLRRPRPPYTLNKGSWQAQGLVAWWPLGEVSDAAYLDYVGRGSYRLTRNGSMAPLAGPGQTDLAASNTGSTSNWLSLGAAPVTAVPLTLAAWFYPVATNANYDLITLLETVSAADYFVLTLGYVTLGRVGAIAGHLSDATAEATTAFTAATWQHACAVFATTTSRAAYWQGRAKGTNTTSVVPVNIQTTTVGALRGQSTATIGPLNGRMAHACVWNRALSDTEVALLVDPQWRWDLYYPLGRTYLSFAPQAAVAVSRPQGGVTTVQQAVTRARLF